MTTDATGGEAQRAGSQLAALQQEVLKRISAATAALRERHAGVVADRARTTGSTRP